MKNLEHLLDETAKLILDPDLTYEEHCIVRDFREAIWKVWFALKFPEHFFNRQSLAQAA